MLRRTMSTKLMRPEILFDTRQNRIIGPLKVVGFIALISIAFVTGQREDSVCYLEDSTPACANHQLGCGRRQIAILSAEYAYATNCTCKKSKCSTCRSVGRGIPFTPSAQCLSDYRSEDYWNVVNKCSKETPECYITPPSQRYYNECKSFTTLSRIQYRCVDAKYEINMCGGEQQSRYISLFYDGSAFHNESLCMCYITGSNPQSTDTYTITALDIRMGEKNDAELILTSPNNDFKVSVTEKKIRPNTPLGTGLSSKTFLKLQLKSNNTPERIWILIESDGNSDVRVKCESLLSPDEDGARRNPDQEDSEDPRLQQAGTTSFQAGIFLAGVASSFAILCVVLFLVYALIIKRRYDITPKKQNGDPVSVDHPTYAGLAARDHANTYDVVDKRVNTNSHTGVSEVYQNIA